LEMATPTSSLTFLLLIVSTIVLSCDGAAHLPRTKRTVELIEGAKDFILRMAEINATPGRLVWVQVNDENYQGYATEEREPFTLKPRQEKEEATTTEKPPITIIEVQTEKLIVPETHTPPPPPPPITDFYPPSKPSNYGDKSTTEVPAPVPAPQDKKKGLLTSLFSLIFAPKTKKKTETTTETVTVFIPDETTTTASPQISTTERHYLPPPTEAAPPPTLAATTPRPPATTTTVPPVPVHVHHIIQPVHIPIPQPVQVQHPVHVQQPVHVHQPVHIQQPVHVQQPIHVPVSHHVSQSQIQLVGLQQLSLPVCTSSPVSTFQRCLPPRSASLPPAAARFPLTQTSIGQVPLTAGGFGSASLPLAHALLGQVPLTAAGGFVRLPRNINQLQQQHLPLVDDVEDEEDYSDLVADMEYFY